MEIEIIDTKSLLWVTTEEMRFYDEIMGEFEFYHLKEMYNYYHGK